MCNVKCEGRISVRQLCVFKLGLLFAALAWLPSAHADQYPRQSGVEIQDYRFEISLLADSEEISVNETINLSFSADGVRKIDLDLCSLRSGPITPDAFDPCQQRGGIPADSPVSNVAKGMVVTSVLSGDEPLKYEHRDNRLRIYFPRASRVKARMTLSIDYHGVPGSGLLITSEESGENVFFSDNWSNRARNWLATIDHISLKTPKTFSIVAPSHYQVISNGLLESQVDLPGNRRKTVWREDAAIPTWQFSLGAAPMAVHYLGAVRGIELSAWLSADNKSVDLQSVYTKTKSAIEFFSDRIGPYAYQKLANVEAVGGRGAMEFANSIFYFGGEFGALDHEIAHQWFGNTVTEADWDDVWLSEGFATYLALLHTEHLKGRDAFLTDLRRTRDGAVKYALANPNNTIVHKNISDGRVLYNAPQIYSGGAMVLHTLRGIMGDEKFWTTLHLYYERYRGDHATTDDFRRAAEEVCRKSGDCTPDLSDLSWFFDQWVRRGGLPQVKGEWWYDPAKESVVVSFVQSQTQGFYRIPAEIVIETSSEDQTRSRNKSTVILDGATTTLKIPVDAEPADVRFDPDIWAPLVQTEFGRRAAPPSRN